MKKLFLQITSVFVLACFLLASSGFRVIEHYCANENIGHFFLFDKNANCESHVEDDACCADSHAAEAKADDCCKNIVAFFHLIADYLAQQIEYQLSTPLVATLATFFHFSFPDLSVQAIVSEHGGARFHLPGKSILVRISQFLL